MDNKFGIDIKAKADPEQLSLLKEISSWLSNISNKVVGLRIQLPDIFKIIGRVSVENEVSVSPIVLKNQLDTRPQLDQIGKVMSSLLNLILAEVKGIKFEAPKSIKIEDKVEVKDWGELLDSMEQLKKGLNLIINQEKEDITAPRLVEIANFPPRMVPQPVTHMSINSLNGYVKTTAVTVGTTLSTLPSYGVLSGRRSLQIYNNSSDTTIYIGGSDVTSTNGLPVPPLSYSPALDAGIKLIIYGVTSSGTANARIVEISDEESGR